MTESSSCTKHICLRETSFYIRIGAQSKWTDAALILSAVASLTIAILAAQGNFNYLGTTNATYLSHGMYAATATLIIIEIIKATICRFRPIDSENFTTDESVNEAVHKIEFSRHVQMMNPPICPCKITFTNGESIETALRGYSGYIFINVIDKNKLTYEDTGEVYHAHFPKRERRFEKFERNAAQVLKRILKNSKMESPMKKNEYYNNKGKKRCC